MFVLIMNRDGETLFLGKSDNKSELKERMAAVFFDYFYGDQYSQADFVNGVGRKVNWNYESESAWIEYGSQIINLRIIDTEVEPEL